MSSSPLDGGQGLSSDMLLRVIAIAIALIVLSACNLRSRTPQSESIAATHTPAGPPRILIESPSDGDEFVVGEEILVSVSAVDSVGVNRVQLFVDERIARTVASESLQGELRMQAILNYLPKKEDLGSVTLRARAYRGSVVSEPDEIAVVVRESAGDVVATPANPSNLPFIPDDGLCRALINVGLNFRAGPSVGHQVITVLSSGTLARVSGKNDDGSWWKLIVNGRTGWVSADYTTEFGECGAVNVADGG